MTRWAGRVAGVVASVLLSLTTGCAGFFVYPGSANGSSSSGNYVYVANQTAGTVSGFAVGTNSLTAISGSPFNLGFAPIAMVVNPADSILFVSGTSGVSGFLNTYAIGSAGVLSLLKTYSLGTVVENSIDVSPDGNWLVGLEANGTTTGVATVDSFSIATSTGALTGSTGTGYQFPSGTTITARTVKFAPSSEQLVFVALGTAGDLVFSFSDGTWGTTVETLATGSSTAADNWLAVSPNGSYLYAARSSGTAGSLAAYAISGGVVTPLSGTPTIAAGDQPYSVVVNTAGTDVYVANQQDNTISGYSVGSGGTLSALSGSPFSNGSAPTALAVDSTGSYLLAISNTAGTDNLVMYSFGSAGNPVSAASATAGTGPVALAATH
jgi:6-phosphogluconolactonase